MIDTMSISTTTRAQTAAPKGGASQAATAQGAEPVAAPTPARPVAGQNAPAARETAASEAEQLQEGLTKDAEGSESLTETVDELNGLMQSIRRELQFSVDEDSGRTVIKVIDAETQEVVRQIPAEEASAVANSLGGQGGSLTRGVRV